MNKTLIIVLVLLVVLGGGYFLMGNKDVEAPLVNEDINLTESKVADGVKIFSIVPTDSKAVYEVDEVLRGTPTHVVGSTQNITGSVSLDVNSNQIKSANVVLDASSFKTDISTRDDNVRKLVLKAEEPGNESITFNLISISGIDSGLVVGQEMPVSITGDLAILGVVKPTTFSGIVSLSESGALRIIASADITYADFGVVIPDFPFLSNIGKIAKLSVDLLAR